MKYKKCTTNDNSRSTNKQNDVNKNDCDDYDDFDLE